MTEEEKKDDDGKDGEPHNKQIKAKAKEHGFDRKKTNESLNTYHETKHREDWGEKQSLESLASELETLMDSCATYYADVFTLAGAAAKFYIIERLKAPVRGEQRPIIKSMIDEWISHVNIINTKFAYEILEGLEHIEKESFDDGKKKGLLSKTVGKAVGKVTDAADKTSRTLTFNAVKLKDRREIKI